MTDRSVLFLDDCPNRQNAFRSSVPHATIVATAAEAIEQLRTARFDVVFLDHDLGGEVYVDSSRADTGMEVVRHMVESRPKVSSVIVHTMNPAAGDAMTASLAAAGYDTFRAVFGSPTFRLIANQL